MNVYDFDGTIYDGDSTMDLYRFCLLRRPYLIIYLPRQIHGRRLYSKGKIDRTMLKQYLYTFFRGTDMVKMSARFWDKRESKFMPWYAEKHRDDDVVISASPEFHIIEGCRRLGITNVIASQVDPADGRCLGPNCRDEEKVRRFRERFGDAVIDEFYSDTEHDRPLARLAKHAYIVRDGAVADWDPEDLEIS